MAGVDRTHTVFFELGEERKIVGILDGNPVDVVGELINIRS